MVPPNLTVVQSCDRLHTIKVKLYMTFPLPYLSNTHTRCSRAFSLQLGHSCLVVVFAFFYMMQPCKFSSAMAGIIICCAALATLTCGL